MLNDSVAALGRRHTSVTRLELLSCGSVSGAAWGTNGSYPALRALNLGLCDGISRCGLWAVVRWQRWGAHVCNTCAVVVGVGV